MLVKGATGDYIMEQGRLNPRVYNIIKIKLSKNWDIVVVHLVILATLHARCTLINLFRKVCHTTHRYPLVQFEMKSRDKMYQLQQL